MKTSWEFTPEDIMEILTINKKVFGYMKNTLTHFYIETSKDKISFFLKDVKGILKYSKELNYINKPQNNSLKELDLIKFMTSLLRFQITGAVILITEKHFLIKSSQNVTTEVKLSYQNIDEDFSSFLKEKEDNISNMVKYKHTEEAYNLFNITSKLMSIGNANNSLNISKQDKDSISTYADRSLIYREINQKLFTKDTVNIHTFFMGFINTMLPYTKDFYMDFKNNSLYFKSKDFQGYLLSENPEISIPSSDDLKAIIPNDTSTNILEIPLVELIEALNFFEGFFERDVWKPITFIFKKNKAYLKYSSPTTEIEKELEGNLFLEKETEFTLMSSPLQLILNNLLNDKGEDLMINIKEIPEKPGVYIYIDDIKFELILAKLNY